MVRDKLDTILQERILILDGAMGTMIQKHKLSEQQFKGREYKDFPHSLKGNNDLLSITQPEIIQKIHEQFLESGADIIETNTFNSTSISMADYHMESEVVKINKAAAKLARAAADKYSALTPNKPRFVVGSLGPTSKTASLSPDVNDPGYRGVTFDQLVDAYTEQATALIQGGVDLLMIETVFDTLNCKAAIFALLKLKKEQNSTIPIMISGTITDASGRTLSGQTVEAFWNSVNHADLFSIGINCALGAEQMRPYVEELSKIAWCYVSSHPNAGLPNEMGEYDETPQQMCEVVSDFAKGGLVNILGGCCGTTPEHITAIAEQVKDLKPRSVPELN